ncbi:MAG: hypothetical protein ABIK77_02620 [candidate division WOR-3 bacterium]
MRKKIGIKQLKKYGFKYVGRWLKVKSKIDFEFESKFKDYKEKRVIYAFVVDNKVRYIGCCQKRDKTLGDRLKSYKYGIGKVGKVRKTGKAGKETYKWVAQNIKECLENNKVVKIFALEPKGKIRYKNLLVDLINGLENPLINKFNPKWKRLK